MAANPNKISTLSIPSEVVDSDWRDDIDVDFCLYGNDEKQEGEYISPSRVSKESIDKIKKLQVELSFKGLKKLRERELARA